VAKTKKRFAVWLGPTRSSGNSFRPLKKQYIFVAGDLSWEVDWRRSEEVAIDLFDYGHGVSSIDARKTGVPSNHVASLLFRQTANGRFLEVK